MLLSSGVCPLTAPSLLLVVETLPWMDACGVQVTSKGHLRGEGHPNIALVLLCHDHLACPCKKPISQGEELQLAWAFPELGEGICWLSQTGTVSLLFLRERHCLLLASVPRYLQPQFSHCSHGLREKPVSLLCQAAPASPLSLRHGSISLGNSTLLLLALHPSSHSGAGDRLPWAHEIPSATPSEEREQRGSARASVPCI